jgi:hypothetical protein
MVDKFGDNSTLDRKTRWITLWISADKSDIAVENLIPTFPTYPPDSRNFSHHPQDIGITLGAGEKLSKDFATFPHNYPQIFSIVIKFITANLAHI